ncbi:MAG TPA: hypothetical protein VHE61_00120 [Opitutaceae bacterium]|nr:hypothetical protein [Opitutaceae bacterium]
MSGTFSGNVNTYETINADLSGDGYSESVSVSIVDPNESEVSIDRESISAALSSPLSQVITSITTGNVEPTFEFNGGGIQVVNKDVDKYADGEHVGKYIGISGELELSMPQQTLTIPVGSFADVVNIEAACVVNQLAVSLSAGGAYDESSSNYASPSITLSGSADISVGGGVAVGVPTIVTCDVDVSLGGPLRVQANGPGREFPDHATAAGSMTGGPLTGYVTVSAEFDGITCSSSTRVCTIGNAASIPFACDLY